MKQIEKKIIRTIRQNKLFTKKDKIGVAVSGGKDSTVCLYILNKLGYNVEGITIDVAIGNYTKENLENIRSVCQEYSIPLHVISFREEFGMSLCYIRSILKSKGYNYSSCMLCGILKRYLLNKYSRKLGFDYLATGHNLDDEAQTFMMNVFRNDFRQAARQSPKPGIIRSKSFVQRVKPLYEVMEEEVKEYSKKMKFPVNYDPCPCSVGAYRREYKDILDEFEKKHPSVKYNIIKFAQQIEQEVKGKMSVCKTCGEPASNDECRTCVILGQMR